MNQDFQNALIVLVIVLISLAPLIGVMLYWISLSRKIKQTKDDTEEALEHYRKLLEEVEKQTGDKNAS